MIPRATYLQSFLPLVHNVIRSVLLDLRHGTASRHGFSAFFKTASNAAVVKDVFLHMLNGTPIPDIENLGAVYRPTFRCVNNVTSDQWLLDACTNLEAVAFVYRDKEFVILCPFFRTLITDYSLRWPPTRYYPTIINNEVIPNSKLLGINQFASIIHELAHMYIDAPMWESRTGPMINPPSEVLKLGDCVALNATASTKNAQSYALYAAGE